MNPAQPVPRLAMAVIAAVTAAAVGCAAGGFKVPAAEVQRLAQLPPAERGRQVRVVPWDGDPPPSIAPAPTPPAQPIEIDPIWNGDVYVDLPIPIRHAAPTSPAPQRIASTGTFRGAPVTPPALAGRGSQGGWRGSPPPSSSSPSPSPARFSSPSFPAPRGAPSARKGGGGGGGGGGDVIAAVILMVLVVGLVVVIASAAADAEEETAYARSFDGWVTVNASQLIHLRYSSGLERFMPLSALTPRDTVDVRYGYLRERDGPVVPLQPPPPAPLPPAGRPLPPKPTPPQPLLPEEPDG